MDSSFEDSRWCEIHTGEPWAENVYNLTDRFASAIPTVTLQPVKVTETSNLVIPLTTQSFQRNCPTPTVAIGQAHYDRSEDFEDKVPLSSGDSTSTDSSAASSASCNQSHDKLSTNQQACSSSVPTDTMKQASSATEQFSFVEEARHDSGEEIDSKEPGRKEPVSEEPGRKEPVSEEPGRKEPVSKEPGTNICSLSQLPFVVYDGWMWAEYYISSTTDHQDMSTLMKFSKKLMEGFDELTRQELQAKQYYALNKAANSEATHPDNVAAMSVDELITTISENAVTVETESVATRLAFSTESLGILIGNLANLLDQESPIDLHQCCLLFKNLHFNVNDELRFVLGEMYSSTVTVGLFDESCTMIDDFISFLAIYNTLSKEEKLDQLKKKTQSLCILYAL
ncbi:hypothetical protein EB796_008364 [Bugula neritina]|uniref:Uncharacterized protein n=1 Tax=Bugula neritina TaxID=10212 RepID=A0A7J7K3X4_BUGNE|nr:hypothetical protein EB796_008364 [Bugula neritina]